jgi:hypothetical protein
MKLGELRSIGHNIADSLASGEGLPIGYYDTDIFGEASRAPGGVITVDFLTGTCVVGAPSAKLAGAVRLYRDALAKLCVRHSTSISIFQDLTAQYSTGTHGRSFVVTIEDEQGNRVVDEYVGVPGRRVRVLDNLGRVRRKSGPVRRA